MKYFTNLKLAAIWGWFPYIFTMIPGFGHDVRSLSFTQIYPIVESYIMGVSHCYKQKYQGYRMG